MIFYEPGIAPIEYVDFEVSPFKEMLHEDASRIRSDIIKGIFFLNEIFPVLNDGKVHFGEEGIQTFLSAILGKETVPVFVYFGYISMLEEVSIELSEKFDHEKLKPVYFDPDLYPLN